ncbi:MAG TPA: tRNA uracil 4-sulfurtransferase ThiI [Actinomycetota bacterium]|nr:tRNA uracil 4-sulfurtransferase ThiI [Actinomycetota bacterium]
MSAARPHSSEAAVRGPVVVVHYHEIGLKGRNRGMFERMLLDNLRDAIPAGAGRVEGLNGRILVHTGGAPRDDVLEAAGSTFGIASYSPGLQVAPSVEEMTSAALELLEPLEFRSFAVAARRSDKQHPLTSNQMNVQIGDRIRQATAAAVHLDDPDATVHAEVLGSRALVYVDRRRGPGGLPVGSSGRVGVLLSGGIDSPVAAYRMMRRGARAVLIHFHSAPFTDRAGTRKAVELAATIARRQGTTKLFLVALGETQREIVSCAPPALRVVLYRRFMVRIAGQLARSAGAKALVTGDSLGQVASQTLENLACVDDAAPMPLLRPLIGDDKQDIIDEARRIGTYELSIQPYADCCSMFVPRSPATRASVRECLQAEVSLDVDALVRRCAHEAEVLLLARDGSVTERVREPA